MTKVSPIELNTFTRRRFSGRVQCHETIEEGPMEFIYKYSTLMADSHRPAPSARNNSRIRNTGIHNMVTPG